jgi:hypothetical protein
MAKEPHITPMEARFFLAYINGKTLTDAYLSIRPKVTRKSAGQCGHRLLDQIKQKASWHELLNAADLGPTRLVREVDRRLRAETTHFYQDKAVADVEDNATRMRATELLARMLGKLRTDIDLHTDTIEIIPPPLPGEEQADDD